MSEGLTTRNNEPGRPHRVDLIKLVLQIPVTHMRTVQSFLYTSHRMNLWLQTDLINSQTVGLICLLMACRYRSIIFLFVLFIIIGGYCVFGDFCYC